MAHIEGTWQVEMLGKHYKVATEENLIADIHGGNQEERLANAKLVAAAPTMLKELENCMEVLNHAINATPRGELRNKLCDTYISIKLTIQNIK